MQSNLCSVLSCCCWRSIHFCSVRMVFIFICCRCQPIKNRSNTMHRPPKTTRRARLPYFKAPVQADLSVSPRGFLIRSNHTIRKQRSAEPIAIRLNDFIISINNRIRYKIQLFCDSVLKIHCISTFMPSDCNWLRRTLFPYNNLGDGLKLATPNAVSAPTSPIIYPGWREEKQYF